MRVRPITRDDLSRVTTIANEAFVDDELFTYLCPGKSNASEKLASFRQPVSLLRPALGRSF